MKLLNNFVANVQVKITDPGKTQQILVVYMILGTCFEKLYFKSQWKLLVVLGVSQSRKAE